MKRPETLRMRPGEALIINTPVGRIEIHSAPYLESRKVTIIYDRGAEKVANVQMGRIELTHKEG